MLLHRVWRAVVVNVYMDTLTEDFNAQVPSLKKCYKDLSVAMHTANADTVLFDKIIEDIKPIKKTMKNDYILNAESISVVRSYIYFLEILTEKSLDHIVWHTNI